MVLNFTDDGIRRDSPKINMKLMICTLYIKYVFSLLRWRMSRKRWDKGGRGEMHLLRKKAFVLCECTNLYIVCIGRVEGDCLVSETGFWGCEAKWECFLGPRQQQGIVLTFFWLLNVTKTSYAFIFCKMGGGKFVCFYFTAIYQILDFGGSVLHAF